jgi:hypothetical protein
MFTRNFHRAGRAIGHGEAGRLILICVAIAALVLAACEHNPFIDDGKLNPDLIGTFVLEGGSYRDEIICTETTLTLNSEADGVSYLSKAGTIEYVYNFGPTSGCLILRYTTGPDARKYGAMYFSHINSASVLWGDAYNADWSIPTADTLEAAKEKFKPENATLYGGGAAQQGTPQLRQ